MVTIHKYGELHKEENTMDSKEKLGNEANIAFEPYFDENTDTGVKLSSDAPDVQEVVDKDSDVVASLEEVKEDNDLQKDKKKSSDKKEVIKKKKKPVDAKGVEGKKKASSDVKKKKKKPVTDKPVTEGVTATDGEKKLAEKKPAKKKPAKKKPVNKKPANSNSVDKKPSGEKTVAKKTSGKKSSKSKGKNGGLKLQLIALVAVPIAIVSVVLTFNTASALKENIIDTEKQGLKTTAITLQSTFEGMALQQDEKNKDINYKITNNNSTLYQGKVKITGCDTIVDAMLANGDVEVSFVYDKYRLLTTLVDANGEKMTKSGLNGNNTIDENIYQKVVVGGEEYFDTALSLNGGTYFGYYMPIKNNVGTDKEESVGLIFVARNSDEIEDLISSETTKAIIICAILSVASIVLAVMIANNISKRINRLAGNLSKISDGNLAINIDKKALKSTNEIGMIGRAADRLKDSLTGIVGNIKESVEVLNVSATNLEGTSDRTNTTMIEVSKAVEEIADSAGVQASETEKATVNAMDMGNLIENVIHNVEELQNTAKVMDEAEKASSEIINELSESNDRTIEAVERIAVQAEYTNVSAQKIKKAVALITSIADETALLSLNASIEAARAGEAGRGFAVVASEISKLADQSNNSATEIEKIINELLIESNKTVDIMDEVKTIVSEQEEKLKLTKDEFQNVSKGIESSVAGVENISGRMVELEIAKNGIIDVIQSLSAISEENAAATEETSASVQELDSTVGSLSEAAKDLKIIAEQLEQQISVFTVK